MTKINTGGPAFPLHPGILPEWTASAGMTLRDYIAAKALQGLLANPDPSVFEETFEELAAHFSRVAYAYADAMLSAREVQP